MPPAGHDEDDRRVDVLLTSYEAALEDDGNDHNLFVAIIGTAMALLTGLGALMLRGDHSGMLTGQHTAVVFATSVAIPFLPIALLAYATTIATRVVLRSYYLRTIEWELHRRSGAADDGDDPVLWMHLELDTSGHHLAPRSLRIAWNMIWIALVLLVGGVTYLAAMMNSADYPELRILCCAIILLSISVPIRIGHVNVMHGRRLWSEAKARAIERLGETKAGLIDKEPGTDTSPQSLASYLLVPRTSDHVGKMAVPIAGLLIGFWLRADRDWSWGAVGSAIATVCIFEQLLYQGRYMINDVRDHAPDGHQTPARKSRRRIPEPHSPSRLRAVLGVALLRISLAFGLTARYTEGPMQRGLLTAMAAVLVAAIPYEFLRQAARRRSARGASPRHGLTNAVILAVGSGYSIRATMGLYIGSGGRASTPSLMLVALSMWAAESSNVAMGWILEGSSYVGRDRVWFAGSIASKPHVEDLAVRAGLISSSAERRVLDGEALASAFKDQQTLASTPVLMQESGTCGVKVWTIAGAVALCLGVWAGVSLVGELPPLTYSMLGMSVGGACLVLMPLRFGGRTPRIVNQALLPLSGRFSMVTAGVVLACVSAAHSPQHPTVAALFPLLIALLLQGTRVATYSAFVDWTANVAATILRTIRSIPYLIVRFLVGDAAGSVLGSKIHGTQSGGGEVGSTAGEEPPTSGEPQ